MKILVTGGSGFIGTNLIEHYSKIETTEIVNVDTSPPRDKSQHEYWNECNILDFDKFHQIVMSFEPEFVIHLAARADLRGSSLDDYSTNTDGVNNLLLIGNQIDSIKKIVFTSTMLVCKVGYVPKDYDDYCPPNYYGESKMIGENMVKNHPALRFDWTIVRPTSIWGPWFGSTYRVFFDLIKQGKYFNFSGMMATKTYGYIGNTVIQFSNFLASDKSNGRTFYVGDYEPIVIKEWAKIISLLYNRRLYSMPRFLVVAVAKIGDLLNQIGVKFPMTSFRFNNMTTDNILPMDDTRELIPEIPYTIEDGTKKTVNWLDGQ